MAYKAAIFDMDGTILDTLEDLRGSVNAALRREGFPERTTEEVRSFVGNGAAKLVERAVPPGTDAETTRRVLDFYRPYYEAHAQIKTAPYPGVPEALAALRAAGVKLAVVSNKPHPATAKLAERYYPGVFDAVIGARDGTAVKPAPDLLNEAMAALGVRPEETVYVGDSDVDVATAKNAGTDGLAVAWGFRAEAFLRERGAERIVRDTAELIAAVLPQRAAGDQKRSCSIL